MSALVFREATLSEVQGSEDWRSITIGSDEADFHTGVSSGGGYAFKYSDETRFIVWYERKVIMKAAGGLAMPSQFSLASYSP